jgi:intermembrane space import and assembly protein 40
MTQNADSIIYIVSLRPKPQNDSENEHSTQTLDSITPKIREERRQQAAAFEGGVNPQELEEEAGQEAAFNPETGEINWDCPCLGGMAHGPCGEEFKAAFSCFVYSQEEPKGIECIEKFKYASPMSVYW